MLGLVIKNTGSQYIVKTDEGNFIDCRIKGNFRLKGIRSTNPVAYGHRVGTTYAFESEVALDAAVDEAPLIGLHDVLAAGVFDYKSKHYTVMISFSLSA
jgi:hypothetical protein